MGFWKKTLNFRTITDRICNMIRITGKIISVTVLTFVMTVSCGGQKSDSDSRRVGGCSLDTTIIGTALRRAAPPDSAAWIKIHSVRFAGEDRYRKAVDYLIASIDSSGLRLYSCSELVHIESGPCWPPFAITLRTGASRKEDTEPLREMLLDGSLNGLTPSEERPPEYGSLFISCGRYAEDWWTVWYSEETAR